MIGKRSVVACLYEKNVWGVVLINELIVEAAMQQQRVIVCADG